MGLLARLAASLAIVFLVTYPAFGGMGRSKRGAPDVHEPGVRAFDTPRTPVDTNEPEGKRGRPCAERRTSS